MKTCTNCHQQGIGSWVDSKFVCTGCYKLAVAQALAARRKPLPQGPPLDVLDRSPMPATADVTEGNYYFRVPTFARDPKPPVHRKHQCAACGGDLPRRTADRFRDGAREFCTLTCLQA